MSPRLPIRPLNDEHRRRVEEHITVARRVAKSMSKKLPYSFEELLGASYEGLCRAARDYDPELTPDFEKYAVARCWHAIMDECRERDQMSRHGRSLHQTYWRAHKALSESLQRDPSPAEVLTHLGTPEADRWELMAAARSTYELSPFEYVFEFVDRQMSVEDQVGWSMIADDVRRIADTLKPKLRWVYYRVYVDGVTRDLVSKELGVTGSRVSQLCAELVQVLRQRLLVAEAS